MENTENLALPYILPNQAQKHVTNNEALRMLDAIVHLAVAGRDLDAPPASPAPGVRYIVGPAATGAWAGHEGKVAAWQEGDWAFYAPVAGWMAWVHDESRFYLYSGAGWIIAPGGGGSGIVPKGEWSAAAAYGVGDLVEHGGHVFLSNIDANLGNEPDSATPGSTAEWTRFILAGGGGSLNPVPLVGVNATADTGNRLAVSSASVLFGHEGADHRLKINKAASGDTASVLFQTGFVGHAEFGLAGDDDWHVKVSADGSAWHEAIVVDRASGAVSLPNTPSGLGGGREKLAGPRTYYVDGALGDDGNSGLAGGAGAFASIQKAIDVVASSLDIAGQDVTIRIADGTYAAPVVLKNVTGFAAPGNLVIEGAGANPADVTVKPAGTSGFSANSLSSVWDIRNVRIQAPSSGANGLLVDASTVRIGNVDFGTAGNAHIQLRNTASLQALSDYAISGGALAHINSVGISFINLSSRKVTLSGAPHFTAAFCITNYASVTWVHNMTFDGAATGPRYVVSSNGVILANAGEDYLPGSTVGTRYTQGLYL